MKDFITLVNIYDEKQMIRIKDIYFIEQQEEYTMILFKDHSTESKESLEEVIKLIKEKVEK